MLLEVPDVCKQSIWRCLDFQDLCRLSCVARGVHDGADAASVWGDRTRTLILRELKRMKKQNIPAACGLQRQNAVRDLRQHNSSDHRLQAALSPTQQCEREEPPLQASPVRYTSCSFWFDCLRDFYVVSERYKMATESGTFKRMKMTFSHVCVC